MLTESSMGKATSTTVISERVFQWWDYPLFSFLTCLSTSAMFYFWSYWFSLDDWLHFPVTFSVMTFLLLVTLFTNQLRWFSLPYMRRPKPITPRSNWKVAVVTTFVPDAEPLDMLDDTLTMLIHLHYPHDTWVLDENDDERVKALCLRLGAHHFSRKNFSRYQTESGVFQSHCKHGNYNAWLYEIGFDRYDIITAFDVDHVPSPTFLSSVLGYFENPKIGYVQVPQAYYNQQASFIARGAAEETYLYYSVVQMACYAMGYPIVVGCHNTHRVSALKEVGGFAPHDADDLLITLCYRVRAWQGVYVPQILARGVTPVDWRSYLTQQLRWARSVLDIKLRIFPKLAAKLPFKERMIGFVQGTNYVQGSLVMFASTMLVAVMLATGTVPLVVNLHTAWRLLILMTTLQLCAVYQQRFYLDWRSEWGLHWRAKLLQLARWPFFVAALYDVVLDRRFPYALTRKVGENSPQATALWPHCLVVILICAAWIIGVIFQDGIHPLVQLWAAIIVLTSLALYLTGRWKYPEPYDRALLCATRAEDVLP
jgi:cellulose synthase (UDP-forming)